MNCIDSNFYLFSESQCRDERRRKKVRLPLHVRITRWALVGLDGGELFFLSVVIGSAVGRAGQDLSTA